MTFRQLWKTWDRVTTLDELIRTNRACCVSATNFG
jgi:hypothetical protein